MAKIFRFESYIMRIHNTNSLQHFFILVIISLSLECDSRLSQWLWDNDSVLPDGTKWSFLKLMPKPCQLGAPEKSTKALEQFLLTAKVGLGHCIGTQAHSSPFSVSPSAVPPIFWHVRVPYLTYTLPEIPKSSTMDSEQTQPSPREFLNSPLSSQEKHLTQVFSHERLR